MDHLQTAKDFLTPPWSVDQSTSTQVAIAHALIALVEEIRFDNPWKDECKHGTDMESPWEVMESANPGDFDLEITDDEGRPVTLEIIYDPTLEKR